LHRGPRHTRHGRYLPLTRGERRASWSPPASPRGQQAVCTLASVIARPLHSGAQGDTAARPGVPRCRCRCLHRIAPCRPVLVVTALLPATTRVPVADCLTARLDAATTVAPGCRDSERESYRDGYRLPHGPLPVGKGTPSPDRAQATPRVRSGERRPPHTRPGRTPSQERRSNATPSRSRTSRLAAPPETARTKPVYPTTSSRCW
jgi:hypothetical protein